MTVIVSLSVSVVMAQVRTSPNYQIQSDSVNVGGGLGVNSNYDLESTIGEVATGPSASQSFSLRAGYQQMQEVFISLTVPGPVVMDTAIPGITGGVANGSTTVVVTTDSPAGYQLIMQAENTPAMRNGSDTIPDLGAAVQLDYATSAGQVSFGFSPTGINVTQPFKNNSSICGTGGLITPLRCWRGLATSTIAIAQSAGANHPNGATTTIQFRVVHGGGIVVPAGTYVATTTITALPL